MHYKKGMNAQKMFEFRPLNLPEALNEIFKVHCFSQSRFRGVADEIIEESWTGSDSSLSRAGGTRGYADPRDRMLEKTSKLRNNMHQGIIENSNIQIVSDEVVQAIKVRFLETSCSDFWKIVVVGPS